MRKGYPSKAEMKIEPTGTRRVRPRSLLGVVMLLGTVLLLLAAASQATTAKDVPADAELGDEP